MENSIKLEPPRDIVNSGKIYVKDNPLFINEKNEGFHIYDNLDPKNPTPLHFLAIPGSSDLAIRDTFFYINQAVDLVTLSLDMNTKKISITGRTQNVFPGIISPDGVDFGSSINNEIVTNWVLKN